MENITTAYRFKDGIYLNITNRCPNLCSFCIKTKWKMDFDKFSLNLNGQEPAVEEVLSSVYKEMEKGPYKEIVFCGYGEATMRLEELKLIAKTLKDKMAAGEIAPVKIRLNTVGLGNKIWKRNIVPELKGLIDIIYISLNSYDEKQWREIVRPAPGYEDGFLSVVEFIKNCVGNFDKVVVSTVDNIGVNAQEMQKFVEGLGAQFYLREFLDANE